VIRLRGHNSVVRIDHWKNDGIESYTVVAEAVLGPELTNMYYARIEIAKMVDGCRVYIRASHSIERPNYVIDRSLKVVVSGLKAEKVFSSINAYYQKLKERRG